MKSHVTLPNLISTGNLAAGFFALLVLPSSLLLATGLVSVAGLLDAVDGTIARRRAGDHTFGSQLDSLADLVSFGLVPAVALYHGALEGLPVLGVLGSLAFLVAGAWRLARFPLVRSEHCFVGLPIPPAGVIAMLLALWSPAPVAVLVLVMALSALMVSTVPFPTVADAARGSLRPRRPPRPAPLNAGAAGAGGRRRRPRAAARTVLLRAGRAGQSTTRRLRRRPIPPR